MPDRSPIFRLLLAAVIAVVVHAVGLPLVVAVLGRASDLANRSSTLSPAAGAPAAEGAMTSMLKMLARAQPLKDRTPRMAPEKPAPSARAAARPAHPAPPPRKPSEKIRIGSDNGDPERVTVAWISYNDFQKLVAPRGPTEQPALQKTVRPVAGAPLRADAEKGLPGQPGLRPTPPGAASLTSGRPGLLPLPLLRPQVAAAPPAAPEQPKPGRPAPPPTPPSARAKPAVPAALAAQPAAAPLPSPAGLKRLPLAPVDSGAQAGLTGHATPGSAGQVAMLPQPGTGLEPSAPMAPPPPAPAPPPASAPKLPTPTPPTKPSAPAHPSPPELAPPPPARLITRLPSIGPLAPQAPGGAGQGEGGKPSGSPRSDAESPAVMLTDHPINVPLKPGAVITGRGIEIKPVVPRITTVARFVIPRNPVAKLRFDNKSGQVIFAELTTSTGYENWDGPVLASLYEWRATGKLLKQLHKPFEIEVHLLFAGD